jgi:tetratricopeptide (TPR) repeat protein
MYAEAYNSRDWAYKEKGQYDKAISDYNKAIEINPRLVEAYNNRGLAYFYKREYDKAWDDVHKAEGLGAQVHPGFLKALRQASGREK